MYRHSFSSWSRRRKRDVAKLPTEVRIDKIRMYEFVNDQLRLSPGMPRAK
jgi:hypothetical protein